MIHVLEEEDRDNGWLDDDDGEEDFARMRMWIP